MILQSTKLSLMQPLFQSYYCIHIEQDVHLLFIIIIIIILETFIHKTLVSPKVIINLYDS